MKNSEVRIGISNTSLLPMSFGQNGPKRVRKFLDSLDFELGLQITPIRGWDPQTCAENFRADQIISVNMPWPHDCRTSSLNDLANKLMLPTSAADTARELVKKFPDSIAIDTDTDNSLIEISLSRKNYNLWDYVSHEAGLALDTYNIRERRGRNQITDEPISFVRSLLECEVVNLVHFQTRKKSELKNFLNKEAKRSFLLKVLSIISGHKHGKLAPIIIELPPHFLFSAKENKIKEIVERIQSIYQ